jgi:hypothetical protein
MADVDIPDENWRELRRTANAYVPAVISAQARNPGFTNAQLHQAGLNAGLKQFSAHIVGAGLRREAITHQTAEKFLKAYDHLPEELTVANGAIGERNIICAFFALPQLKGLLDGIGMTVERLSKDSKVSPRAIAHAINQGRVTAGIVTAFHGVLQNHDSTVAIREIATSSPLERVAPKKIQNTPFSLSDLLLAPADLGDERWP